MGNSARAKSWFPNVILAYTKTGSPAAIKYHTVKTGVQLETGVPVIKDDLDVDAATAESGTIYGFTIAPGDGDSSDPFEKTIPIILADRNHVFMARADEETDTISALPLLCDLVNSDGHWRADIGANEEDVLRVVNLVEGDDDEDDDEPGRVLFEVHRSSYDGLIAAK